MTDHEEQTWTRGYRAALTSTLQHALQGLGYEGSQAEHSRWLLERERAVSVLRRLCEKHGDNDWPNDLDLSDVIDKHLACHLEG